MCLFIYLFMATLPQEHTEGLCQNRQHPDTLVQLNENAR